MFNLKIKYIIINSFSLPLIDGLNIAKDHTVLARTEVFRHGYFMILFILGLAHILDVLATMCEVTDL